MDIPNCQVSLDILINWSRLILHSCCIDKTQLLQHLCVNNVKIINIVKLFDSNVIKIINIIYPQVVRDTVKHIGYDDSSKGEYLTLVSQVCLWSGRRCSLMYL